MSKRTNQNSILVLATLGVYLGLVFVGATPQVLAQAAMTREFNVKDEIELKEDLDNKPPENFDISVQNYLEDVEYFLYSLQRLRRDHKFDPAGNGFDVAQATLLPCVDANQVGSYTAEKFVIPNEFVRPVFTRFSNQLTDGYSLQDCLPSEKFPGIEVTSSRFELKLDTKSFSVEVAVKKASPRRAAELADTLRTTIDRFRQNAPTPVRTQLIDNTAVRAENTQVFVVTRLPRAGLDSLLAVDAK